MDIKQIRLRNLRILIGEAGTIANLARLSKTAPAYLSQILNSLPTSTGRPRSVGDKLARKLETAMNKSYGWMDKGNQDWPELTTAASKDTVRYAPLIEEPLIASYTSSNPPPRQDTEQIPIPIDISLRSFAFRVTTDAMEPKFLNGDIVIIDPTVEPRVQDYILVLDTLKNATCFRQLVEDGQQRYLKPLNSHYPLQELQANHRIIGKAVYRGEIL